MARGQHPAHFFKNPNLRQSPARIWEDLNNFTDEVFEENVERYSEFSAFILLPPTFSQEGKFVKGILATHATDFLLARWPWLKQVFHIVAYAMWSGYPRAEHADAFMVPYDNPARKAWYDKKYPAYSKLPIFPVDDTDLFNEALMVPANPPEKTIDVLQVARLDQIKNLDIFAKALKIIARKQGKPLRALLHTGSVIDAARTGLRPSQTQELDKIQAALGHTDKYLTISPGHVSSTRDLYQKSRVVVMTALCEGRNRSIHEAMSCNTPVVTFEDFNKYSRGNSVVFPAGGGYRAPKFTAESLAETILRTLNAPEGTFSPREAVLRESGRRAVANTVVRGFAEYYSRELPGYGPEQPIESNEWLAQNMQAVYKQDLPGWWFRVEGVIGKPRFHIKGLKDFEGVAKAYSKLVLPGTAQRLGGKDA